MRFKVHSAFDRFIASDSPGSQPFGLVSSRMVSWGAAFLAVVALAAARLWWAVRSLRGLRGLSGKEKYIAIAFHYLPKILNRDILPAVYAGLTTEIAGQYPIERMLPLLAVAPKLRAADFSAGDRVSVEDGAVASRKIVSLPHRVAPLKAALAKYDDGEAADLYAWLDAVVEADVLPSLAPGTDGRRVRLEDCAYYCLNKERGAYFPVVHWDTDWVMFPGCRGFQLWFLVDGHTSEKERGNMYMVRTPDLLPTDPPVRYLVQRDGSVLKLLHDARKTGEFPLRRFESIDEIGLKFEYLDMAPGDCVIMGKRHLHMSDPRLLVEKIPNDRLAVNVRVMIKEKGADTVPFWPFHDYNHAIHQRLKHKAYTKPIVDGHIAHVPVHRYEMLNIAWSEDWD